MNMKLGNVGAVVRFWSVCLIYALLNICYFVFSHYVHPHCYVVGEMHHGHMQNQKSHDNLLLYGIALPLALLSVAGLIWHPNPNNNINIDASVAGSAGREANGNHSATHKVGGDVNVKKWTIIWFLLPLLIVMLDGTFHGHNVLRANESQAQRGENLYVRLCLSLQSPAGYAATWALALFLIPVTKHSPILDWLRITPVQALAYHRIAGWTSFWLSVLHGFLHMRHQMDFLNPQRERTRMEQLKLLLVPSSWSDCIATQNPWHVFWGQPDAYPGVDEDASYCRRVLVNDTGLVSCAAFTLLAVTSLPGVRRKFYTFFYCVHIPAAWVMLIHAIWHYSKIALILVPGITYYLSFAIPISVARAAELWAQWRQLRNRANASALVEANLIQGGSIELTFATSFDLHRYESSYVNVYFPDVSLVSHPFSTFSRDALMNAGCNGESSSTTKSILLRSKGPFVEGLKKALFPCRPSTLKGDLIAEDEDGQRLFPPSPETKAGEPVPKSSSPNNNIKIYFDSYYAGSFDWTNHAMSSHDEILIVAGGVGIVPFLDFLPTLQRRIRVKQDFLSEQCLAVGNSPIGPKRIYLDWYCREVGLASYVWHNYLYPHVRDAWENNSTCRGRLKIRIHLTSLKPVLSVMECGESALASIPESELAEKIDFGARQQQDSIFPVQDARFMQSLGLRILGPGLIMVAGTALHWWWYGKVRHSNLVIRSHGIVFSLVLAVIISIMAELYLRHYKDGDQEYISVNTRQKGDIEEEESMVEMITTDDAKILETAGTASSESMNLFLQDENSPKVPPMGSNMDSDFLTVKRGRPRTDDILCDIIKAQKPGVFSCGPRSMIDRLEESIRLKREDCAFYKEDSDM
eukprot:CAMPEP_0183729530 /NCGR_PEP_ID=MMETSP0737-20130205/30552_1 /TAXON_ID=385413 /ORGANISM="Thalassiosira miniscula, Strain CCMP1093" /LENGTH=861 /DNA_ID=CAMNT_0025961743 /DNA_START=193 /DNA_END=2778 /DNA_ORIENTATION=+